MNQSENKVRVEGILSEVDLTTGSFVRDGINHEYIRGSIKVLVNQEVNGKMTDMYIPINTFTTRLTRNGGENPAYKSMKDVMDNFTSIAACGDIDKADRVRITSGTIKENSYYTKTGALVNSARLETSFVNKIAASECKPEATFTATIVVGSKAEELDRDGMPTGRMNLNGILVQWGDRADLIKFIVADPNAQAHINQYWNDGDTVRIKGKINFSSKVEFLEEEMGFGEPIKTAKTTSIHELLIVSGSASALEAEAAFDINEIQAALAARKVRIESEKTKRAEKERAAEASKLSSSFGF